MIINHRDAAVSLFPSHIDTYYDYDVFIRRNIGQLYGKGRKGGRKYANLYLFLFNKTINGTVNTSSDGEYIYLKFRSLCAKQKLLFAVCVCKCK